MRFESLVQELEEEVPVTWIPALLAVLVKRAAQERVFTGISGICSFVTGAFKKWEGNNELLGG